MNHLNSNIDPKGIALILAVFMLVLTPSFEGLKQNHLSGEPCNGTVENCDKAYTDVTYPETHNAHSTLDDGFNYLAANHRENISSQWDAGYRAFMMDVHHSRYSEDLVNTSFCHGSYDTGIHPVSYTHLTLPTKA